MSEGQILSKSYWKGLVNDRIIAQPKVSDEFFKMSPMEILEGEGRNDSAYIQIRREKNMGDGFATTALDEEQAKKAIEESHNLPVWTDVVVLGEVERYPSRHEIVINRIEQMPEGARQDLLDAVNSELNYDPKTPEWLKDRLDTDPYTWENTNQEFRRRIQNQKLRAYGVI